MPTYTLIVKKKGEQAESMVAFREDSLDAAFRKADLQGYQVLGQAKPSLMSSQKDDSELRAAKSANRTHTRNPNPAPEMGTVELGPATLKSIERAIGKQVLLALVLFCLLLPLILFAFGAIFTFLTTDPNAI